MKLRTRFAFVISGLVVVVLAGCSALILWSERSFLVSQVESQQEALAGSLARVARESHLSKDDLVLLNYIRSLSEDHPALERAWVVRRADNVVVAHTDENMVGLPAAALGAAPASIRVAVRAARIGGSEPFLAFVGFSRPAIQRVVADELVATQIRVVWVSLLMLAVGVLLAVWLAGTMTRPIRELMEAASAIGRGQLGTRLRTGRRDELGQLASRFNDMAGELERLDEMKRDFVWSVTHELKSPLSAIESYLDLILFENRLSRASVDRWVEYTSYIKTNTARLSRFIGDLLDAAKIEIGSFEIRKVPMSAETIAREVVGLFEARARSLGVALTLEPGVAAPPVEADPERVRQVVVNLVSNSLKFTPEGGTVRVRLEPAGGELIVTVADTGAGIAPESMPRLFKKFEQAPGSRAVARGPKGTGLGLFIAKSIVEAHGGRIWAESKPGAGSSFHFTLKRLPEEGAKAQAKVQAGGRAR